MQYCRMLRALSIVLKWMRGDVIHDEDGGGEDKDVDINECEETEEEEKIRDEEEKEEEEEEEEEEEDAEYRMITQSLSREGKEFDPTDCGDIGNLEAALEIKPREWLRNRERYHREGFTDKEDINKGGDKAIDDDDFDYE